jgi:hypothetical protein
VCCIEMCNRTTHEVLPMCNESVASINLQRETEEKARQPEIKPVASISAPVQMQRDLRRQKAQWQVIPQHTCY